MTSQKFRPAALLWLFRTSIHLMYSPPEKPPRLADEVFALAIIYLNVKDHFDA
jgi:hypothetical protein